MTLVSFCGVAILACVLCVLLDRLAPGWGRMVSIAASLLLLTGAIMRLQAQWQTVEGLFSFGNYGALFSVLGKAMGVALLVETTADICRESGADVLATRLLFLGKTEILLLSIPLMRSLLELMQEVLA